MLLLMMFSAPKPQFTFPLPVTTKLITAAVPPVAVFVKPVPLKVAEPLFEPIEFTTLTCVAIATLRVPPPLVVLYVSVAPGDRVICTDAGIEPVVLLPNRRVPALMLILPVIVPTPVPIAKVPAPFLLYPCVPPIIGLMVTV